MKLIVFDLDGTLCDTLADITTCLNRVLAAQGYATYTVAQVSAMVGRGAPYMIAAAAPNAAPEELAELSSAYFADYAKHLAATTRPYAGIPETLATLRARGHTLAVVTNKPHAHAVRLVQELFPPHGEIFARVQGQTPKFETKPDPESLFFVLESLGAAPGEAIYVGDSDVDLAFAQNAGLPFVGCAWGFRGRAALEAAGATTIIDKPEELLTKLR